MVTAPGLQLPIFCSPLLWERLGDSLINCMLGPALGEAILCCAYKHLSTSIEVPESF